MQNKNFDQEFNAALAEAQDVEDKWAKKSPENIEMIKLFPSNFEYKDIFTICPRFDKDQFKQNELVQGRRISNGDAWGIIVSFCTTCGFCKNWIWDEY